MSVLRYDEFGHLVFGDRSGNDLVSLDLVIIGDFSRPCSGYTDVVLRQELESLSPDQRPPLGRS